MGRGHLEGDTDAEFLQDLEGVLDDLEIGLAADEDDHDVHARSPPCTGADVAAVMHGLEMDPADGAVDLLMVSLERRSEAQIPRTRPPFVV